VTVTITPVASALGEASTRMSSKKPDSYRLRTTPRTFSRVNVSPTRSTVLSE